MPRLVQRASLALVPVLALALGGSTAQASFQATVTPTVTPQGGGLSLFTYTVTVPATSTTSVSEFDVNLTTGVTVGVITPVGAAVTPVAMPPGFINLYTSGDPIIQYLSTDPATDIKPGGTGVFSFTSATGNTFPQFQLLDPTGSAVPEPASVVLFGLGMLGVVGMHARSRRRNPAA